MAPRSSPNLTAPHLAREANCTISSLLLYRNLLFPPAERLRGSSYRFKTWNSGLRTQSYKNGRTFYLGKFIDCTHALNNPLELRFTPSFQQPLSPTCVRHICTATPSERNQRSYLTLIFIPQGFVYKNPSLACHY